MGLNVKVEKVYFKMDDGSIFICYTLDLNLFKISHFVK